MSDTKGDLISREDTLAALRQFYCPACDSRNGIMCRTCYMFDALNVVEDMPAVDAEPVRRGEWAHIGGDEWCCNWCLGVIYTEGIWEKPTKKYCPECGARMMKEEKS